MEEMSISSDSLEQTEMNGQSNKQNENIQENGVCDDSDKENGCLRTKEEAMKYVMEKVTLLLNDPKSNPLLAARLETLEYAGKIQQKVEELNKECNHMEILYRNQKKFLQEQGLMAKPSTKSVGVGINLDIEPEAISALVENPDPMKYDNIATKTLKMLASKVAAECIDLTDDMDTSSSVATGSATTSKFKKHPAPLPSLPREEFADLFLLKPKLKIKHITKGVVLLWDQPEDRTMKVEGYDIFYYQEQKQVVASSSLWKKLCTVKPFPLPMSCVLSNLEAGNWYHFAVRATRENPGPFSDVASAMFHKC